MEEMMKRALLILLLVMSQLVLASHLADGAEIMLTDSRSESIIGYGLVEGGLLDLELSRSARDFVMLIIHSTGEVEILTGEVSLDGDVRVYDPQGNLIGLGAYLADTGLELRVSSTTAVGPENDDDESDDSSLDVPGPDDDDDSRAADEDKKKDDKSKDKDSSSDDDPGDTDH